MPHTGSPHAWLTVGPDLLFRVPMYHHCALARIYPSVTAVYIVATYLFPRWSRIGNPSPNNREVTASMVDGDEEKPPCRKQSRYLVSKSSVAHLIAYSPSQNTSCRAEPQRMYVYHGNQARCGPNSASNDGIMWGHGSIG